MENPALSLRNEYLSFSLNGELYGIDILKVQEIRGFEEPTRLANAQAHSLGVVNLRGVIVPIHDLRLFFGTTKPEYNQQTVTIIIQLHNKTVGIVVDHVSDVVQLDPHQIKDTPELTRATVSTDHLIGIANLSDSKQDRLMIVADIERLVMTCEGSAQLA